MKWHTCPGPCTSLLLKWADQNHIAAAAADGDPQASVRRNKGLDGEHTHTNCSWGGGSGSGGGHQSIIKQTLAEIKVWTEDTHRGNADGADGAAAAEGINQSSSKRSPNKSGQSSRQHSCMTITGPGFWDPNNSRDCGMPGRV